MGDRRGTIAPGVGIFRRSSVDTWVEGHTPGGGATRGGAAAGCCPPGPHHSLPARQHRADGRRRRAAADQRRALAVAILVSRVSRVRVRRGQRGPAQARHLCEDPAACGQGGGGGRHRSLAGWLGCAYGPEGAGRPLLARPTGAWTGTLWGCASCWDVPRCWVRAPQHLPAPCGTAKAI
jgi:hypothetical protein